MEPLRKPNRNPAFLTAGISGIVGLAAFVNLLAPDSLWIIAAGILLASLTVASLLHYVIGNLRQTLLLSGAFCLLLTIRALGLKNPVYTLLLIASVISVEISLRKR